MWSLDVVEQLSEILNLKRIYVLHGIRNRTPQRSSREWSGNSFELLECHLPRHGLANESRVLVNLLTHYATVPERHCESARHLLRKTVGELIVRAN